MSIIYFNIGEAGQVGQIPRVGQIVTSDSLSAITAAGYLNNSASVRARIAPTDIFDIIYSYTASSTIASASGFGTGTYGRFTVSIASGVVTLIPWVNSANVLLPVVSGDVAVFNGTTGQIQDSGVLGTDIVSKSATNNMAAGGQIVLDKGTAVTTGGAAIINKQSGVLTTPSLNTASGSAYSITLTNSKITTASILQCQIQGGTNTVAGLTVVAGVGVGTATILIQNSGVAAAPLNGSVILSFVVS